MQPDIHRRMKEYAKSADAVLPGRTPALAHVDGRAFRTLTKGLDAPWDHSLARCMDYAALRLCDEAQGAQLAYIHSDEILMLLINYGRYSTASWFGGRVQKICSVSASLVTLEFARTLPYREPDNEPYKKLSTRASFAASVFCVPREEVCNAFVARQLSCERNGKQALGRRHLGRKKILGMSTDEVTERLKNEFGVNWDFYPEHMKLGRVAVRGSSGRWEISDRTPIFATERDFVDRFVWPAYEEGRYSACLCP